MGPGRERRWLPDGRFTPTASG
nr:unnamed protein product [Digitaria exilis]